MLNRYILRQLCSVFAFGSALFVVLVMSVDIFAGVGPVLTTSPGSAGWLLAYLWGRLPGILVLTFPMATLLSCILVFGRMSHDGELIALLAVGASPRRLMAPALGWCVGCCLVTLLVGEGWAPQGTLTAATALREAAPGSLTGGFLVGPQPGGLPDDWQVVYAANTNAQGTEIQGLFVHHMRRSHRQQDLYAESATWTGNLWLLKNVTEQTFDDNEGVVATRTTHRALVPLDLPTVHPPGPEGDRPDEMTRAELGRRLDRMEPRSSKAIRYAMVYQQKLAFPCSCIVFGLFGIPIALRAPRLGGATGLIVTLGLLFCYYALCTAGVLMATNLHVSPALAAWMPDIVLGLLGGGLTVAMR